MNNTPAYLIAAATAALLAGIPSVAHSEELPPPVSFPTKPPPKEHESDAMMYTGAALTITGAVGLGVGNVVVGVILGTAHEDGNEGDLAGLGAAIYGGSILLASSVLLHVGIPLWAYGASKPDPRTPPPPELRLGAGSVELFWRF